MLKETIEYLDPNTNDIIVDGTISSAGHSLKIAEHRNNGILVVIDQDRSSLTRAEYNLKDTACKKIFIQGNFRRMRQLLNENNISNVNKILLDLGWSNDQFADPTRGFGPAQRRRQARALQARRRRAHGRIQAP